jgi:GT2 family glycosyltransferase
LRSFPTLVEEHLEAIASSDAAAAEHIIVVGPECPPRLRESLAENSSSKIRLVDVPDRFNFAHRCNVARTMSSGAITVLVNDDFVPLRPDWLAKLLEPFADPRVGITGATMLYADDTIQHIGVGVKDGNFQHLYVGAELSETRVAQLIQMNREVDAVTGACLAIRTQLFDDVGGLAEGFPLNFNDIDLCLKVRALGHSIVLVGEPLGHHLESRTRPAVS